LVIADTGSLSKNNRPLLHISQPANLINAMYYVELFSLKSNKEYICLKIGYLDHLEDSQVHITDLFGVSDLNEKFSILQNSSSLIMFDGQLIGDSKIQSMNCDVSNIKRNNSYHDICFKIPYDGNLNGLVVIGEIAKNKSKNSYSSQPPIRINNTILAIFPYGSEYSTSWHKLEYNVIHSYFFNAIVGLICCWAVIFCCCCGFYFSKSYKRCDVLIIEACQSAYRDICCCEWYNRGGYNVVPGDRERPDHNQYAINGDIENEQNKTTNLKENEPIVANKTSYSSINGYENEEEKI